MIYLNILLPCTVFQMAMYLRPMSITTLNLHCSNTTCVCGPIGPHAGAAYGHNIVAYLAPPAVMPM